MGRIAKEKSLFKVFLVICFDSHSVNCEGCILCDMSIWDENILETKTCKTCIKATLVSRKKGHVVLVIAKADVLSDTLNECFSKTHLLLKGDFEVPLEVSHRLHLNKLRLLAGKYNILSSVINVEIKFRCQYLGM